MKVSVDNNMKVLPVYDIKGLGVTQNDILVKPFAPYIEEHQKLLIPHRHSFYHIVYFTKGSGWHTLDFEQFEVKPFQIYFMIPGQVHHWNFHGAADGYVLNFSDSFFQSFLLRPDYLEDFSFFRGISDESIIDIPKERREKVESIFNEMIQIKATINSMNLDRLRVKALELFLNVASLRINKGMEVSASNQTLLRNFQKLIEKHFNTMRLPKDYAALLYVTPNHLNAICSDLLGISAGELIRNRVILEAKRLLVNLQLPISTIAYQLNFSDNSYFTKFFKKNMDITPEEFRKQFER
ncbi:AraC family transcriptional regulator [Olivibacter domesticus]|uniref:Transcriptional regulator, AraC family n=1 Tax=Olivibacter domesticus TaxID=407022 RepID=A0A1H7W6F4_OLID1|nr:helix-turn-helix transcriptional regulator [Olivibacter domesticus]SEM17050.1 transcriptional regulator, AraC family [Olivibacter domesticus]